MGSASTIASEPMLIDVAENLRDLAAIPAEAVGVYMLASHYCWERGGWVIDDVAAVADHLAGIFRQPAEEIRRLLDDVLAPQGLLLRDGGMLSTKLVVDCLPRRGADV
jgi:GTP cyclohydrolase I